jgi:hypothetical protein
MIRTGQNRSTWEKTLSGYLSIKSPKWTGLWLNLGLHGKGPLSKRQGHGAACTHYHSNAFYCHCSIHIRRRSILILSHLWYEVFLKQVSWSTKNKQWIFKHITVNFCLFYLFLLLKGLHLLQAISNTGGGGCGVGMFLINSGLCLIYVNCRSSCLLKTGAFNCTRPTLDGLASPILSVSFHLVLICLTAVIKLLAYFCITYSYHL